MTVTEIIEHLGPVKPMSRWTLYSRSFGRRVARPFCRDVSPPTTKTKPGLVKPLLCAVNQLVNILTPLCQMVSNKTSESCDSCRMKYSKTLLEDWAERHAGRHSVTGS